MNTTHHEHGLKLLEFGHTKEGIDVFNLCLSVDPKDWVALLNLGIAYMDSGDFTNAEKYFSQVEEQNPASVDLYIHRALINIDNEDFNAAFDNLKKAEKYAFDEVWGFIYNAYTCLYIEQESYDKALTYAQKTIFHCPEEEMGYMNAAYIYEEKEEFDNAFRMFDHVLRKINPFHTEALVCRALYVYEEFGELTQAIRDLRVADNLGHFEAGDILKEILSEK